MQKKLEIISQYQQFLLTIPEKIDNSTIKGVEIIKHLGLSKSGFYNKKYGNRTWLLKEVKGLCELLNLDSQPSEEFSKLLFGIEKSIDDQKKFRKSYIYEQVGLTKIMVYVRHKDPENWTIEELKKLFEVLES